MIHTLKYVFRIRNMMKSIALCSNDTDFHCEELYIQFILFADRCPKCMVPACGKVEILSRAKFGHCVLQSGSSHLGE